METVSVNKGTLVALAAVAAASLLGVAFLLGRTTAPGSPPVAAAERGPAPAVSPSPAPTPEPLASNQPVASPGQPSPPLVDVADPVPAPGPVRAGTDHRSDRQGRRGADTSPPEGPSRSTDDPARGAVAAYLAAVSQVQSGNLSGNAESIAGELAGALAKGDTSGLDRMIRETEAERERLSALTPPPACAAHQRESLGSLDDALEMLRSLKASATSSDPAGGLSAVSSRATALRSRADALQREEETLRQRYGLPR